MEDYMEINQKHNKSLINSVCNTIVGALLEQEMISREDLSSLGAHVGYLFTKEDGELEGLFRVSTDNDTFYFALQNGGLIPIDIDDNMYDATISTMKEMHPCLLNDDLPETEAQKARREKNNKIISDMDITTSDKLMTHWEDSEIELKDKMDICKRALACFYVIQVSCDIRNNNYEESLEYFVPLLEKFGLKDVLNEKEQSILDGSYDQQDVFDLDWAYEAYWALCWSLGLVDDIADASDICDCDEAISFAQVESVEEFADKCELRSKEEILDMLDLYLRYNWAFYQARTNEDASCGDLNPSIIIERRRGLEWIVSDEEDWYDLEMRA